MTTHLTPDVLNDFADGRLRPEAHRQAERHLSECGECAARLTALRALLMAARTLPAEVPAPDGSWDAVRARLEATQSQPLPRQWTVSPRLAAAAALVLVAASSAVTLMVARPSVPPVTATPTIALPAAWQASEQGYLSTVDGLMQQLREQRAELSPATVATVEQALATIDTAIDEARAALARDPANAALTDLLASNYRQKVELLRRATRLSAS